MLLLVWLKWPNSWIYDAKERSASRQRLRSLRRLNVNAPPSPLSRCSLPVTMSHPGLNLQPNIFLITCQLVRWLAFVLCSAVTQLPRYKITSASFKATFRIHISILSWCLAPCSFHISKIHNVTATREMEILRIFNTKSHLIPMGGLCK